VNEEILLFASNDEPEPLEMIRINLEASLLALAGKLKGLFDLECNDSQQNSMNNV